MSQIGRLTTPYEGRAATGWDQGRPIPAPLCLHRTTVPQAWVDYNGHMSESCYLLVAGDSADAFFRFVGIDEAYRAGGHSLFTVETHLRHLGEAALGDRLLLDLRVLACDAKRVHVFHEVRRTEPGEAPAPDDSPVIATVEQMLLHVDTGAGRVVAMPDDLQQRIRAVRDAHAALPRPAAVGHVMAVPASIGTDPAPEATVPVEGD